MRIARDMHDVVAHSLAVVIAQADGARYAADPEVAATALSTISTTARAALSDVRMLLT
ncbi:histidine kinase dimerization/phosphoacceptor domain-containing protein, partial [Rhizobium johnstonii]